MPTKNGPPLRTVFVVREILTGNRVPSLVGVYENPDHVRDAYPEMRWFYELESRSMVGFLKADPYHSTVWVEEVAFGEVLLHALEV